MATFRPTRNNAGGASQRQLRVGEEIRHILTQVFVRNRLHLNLIEGNPITVTEVRMSPDLKQARAFIISMGDQQLDDIVKILNNQSPLIRTEMAKQLTIKFMPRLFFKPDLSYRAAAHITDLLRSPHVAQDLVEKSDEQYEDV